MSIRKILKRRAASPENFTTFSKIDFGDQSLLSVLIAAPLREYELSVQR
jgi:hypothetical protein